MNNQENDINNYTINKEQLLKIFIYIFYYEKICSEKKE